MYVVIPTHRSYKDFYEKLKKTIPVFVQTITVYQQEENEGYKKLPDGSYEVTIKQNLYEYGAWIGLQILINANELPIYR